MDDGTAKTALHNFNTFVTTYSNFSLIDKLMEEQYAEVFYEAIKNIPVVGQTLNAAEFVFTIAYSEEFNKSLKNYAQGQLDLIDDNCKSPNCNRLRAEYQNLVDISSSTLENIKQNNESANHQKACTCSK